MIKPGCDQISTLFTDEKDDLVRYLAYRLKNPEDARDLAQEAYLRMLRLKNRDLIQYPEAYLFRIAANLLYEHWLKEKRVSMLTIEAIDIDTLPGPGESLDEQIAQSEGISALERALSLLPPIHRRVVIMHRRDGMTYEEISGQLGISCNMVKKHLAKGLARCRQYLRQHHYE